MRSELVVTLSFLHSRAIVTYLVNKYAPGHDLYPNDAEKRATIDARLNFDIGSLYSNIVKALFLPMRGAPATPEELKTLDEKLALLDGFLEGGYVAGDKVTVADFCVYSSLSFVVSLKSRDLTPYKNILNWFNKLTKDYEQEEANEWALKVSQALTAARKKAEAEAELAAAAEKNQ